MKNLILFIILGLLSTVGFTQDKYIIETKDITNFWKAYDLLASASTTADSIKIIQEKYINISTPYFKEFIKARNFTAEEYVQKINQYPKFWKSVRPLTENIKNRKAEIEKIFEVYRQILSNFKQPNICLAIGCLRTGGTVATDLILIGAEIAVSNNQVDKSEMTGWLASVIGDSDNMVSMIAHETIHTQQFDTRFIKTGKHFLLEQAMTEGIADFFTVEFLGININEKVYQFGEENECILKKQFINDLKNHPKDYQRWLSGKSKTKDKPADLGYFFGHKIAKRYYDNSKDKQKTIEDFLNRKKYKKIAKRSKYLVEDCD